MVNLVCALYANSWYLSHTQRAIALAHAKQLEGQHLLMELVRRGGTSWMGCIGVFFLTGVVGLSRRHRTGGARLSAVEPLGFTRGRGIGVLGRTSQPTVHGHDAFDHRR